MLTKEEFFTKFNGHDNAYSSFKLIGVNPEQVISALNRLGYGDAAGFGAVMTEGNPAIQVVYFEVCKATPDLVYDLTRELYCCGFADIGSWYGEEGIDFIYADHGLESNDFYATWDNLEQHSEDPNLWGAFIKLTTYENGVTFATGEGYVSTETKDRLEAKINEHPFDADWKFI